MNALFELKVVQELSQLPSSDPRFVRSMEYAQTKLRWLIDDLGYWEKLVEDAETRQRREQEGTK